MKSRRKSTPHAHLGDCGMAWVLQVRKGREGVTVRTEPGVHHGVISEKETPLLEGLAAAPDRERHDARDGLIERVEAIASPIRGRIGLIVPIE